MRIQTIKILTFFGLVFFLWNGIFYLDLENFDLSGVISMSPQDALAQANQQSTLGKAIGNVFGNFNAAAKSGGGLIATGASNLFDSAIEAIFTGLLKLINLFISVAIAVFLLVTNDGVMSIIRSNSIYTGWSFVRDTFNIVFILALLFSAFATIFQVQKFHLKNTILMVVIMALLVNFSWPIARIIIDISNVLMFAFYDTGAELMRNILANVKYQEIAIATNANAAKSLEFSDLMLAIIFSFLMMIVMIAISMQLLIRVVALALLLIFAPVGFAGQVFPATKSLATSWWGAFLKYAFVGPAIMFMLAIASIVMGDLNSSISTSQAAQQLNTVKNAAAGSTQSGGDLIVKIIDFIIPLTILYASLLVGNKLGVVGASTIQNQAKRFATAPVRRSAYKKAYGGANRIVRGKKGKDGNYAGASLATPFRSASGTRVGSYVADKITHRKKQKEEKKDDKEMNQGARREERYRKWSKDKRTTVDRKNDAKKIEIRVDHYADLTVKELKKRLKKNKNAQPGTDGYVKANAARKVLSDRAKRVTKQKSDYEKLAEELRNSK